MSWHFPKSERDLLGFSYTLKHSSTNFRWLCSASFRGARHSVSVFCACQGMTLFYRYISKFITFSVLCMWFPTKVPPYYGCLWTLNDCSAVSRLLTNSPSSWWNPVRICSFSVFYIVQLLRICGHLTHKANDLFLSSAFSLRNVSLWSVVEVLRARAMYVASCSVPCSCPFLISISSCIAATLCLASMYR